MELRVRISKLLRIVFPRQRFSLPEKSRSFLDSVGPPQTTTEVTEPQEQLQLTGSGAVTKASTKPDISTFTLRSRRTVLHHEH
ncbi:UNVERIFIED_CONTAM: hypothetical protein FKN15_043313 [Acipenser sinensis]